MKLRDQIKVMPTSNLIMYARNNKKHPEQQTELLASNIKEFGFTQPILIDKDNNIIAGHGRFLAAKKLGMTELPCILIDDLSETQIKALRISDNRLSELADTDWEMLKLEMEELKDLDFDVDLTGFNFDEIESNLPEDLTQPEVQEDDFEPPKEAKYEVKEGDIWQLGEHRLMCGDSSDYARVCELTENKKVDMVFTDPPYGMKKENDGVLNDNLNYDDLLEFNKLWIANSFEILQPVGSWYCWGIDEPLMDIYSNILKPMKKNGELTFRNLITWNKTFLKNGGEFFPMGVVQSEGLRSYAIADEKCLFVMKGVQGFNNNSDNYFEGWEPIRKYLYDERMKCGWDVPTMKKIAGHSIKSLDHWTTKSQWNLVTQEVYNKFKKWAEDNNIVAFTKEYEEIKKEYEEIKKEYYDSRSYFDNKIVKCTNVWNVELLKGDEKKQAGGHATPKPIELCSIAIKSSSRENEKVLDLFGGSGSTLIACEQLNRKCYMMELDPYYCSVIIERWEKLTGKKGEKL